MSRILYIPAFIPALDACFGSCPYQPPLATQAPTDRIALAAGESLPQRFNDPNGGRHQGAKIFIDESPASASRVVIYKDAPSGKPDADSPLTVLKPEIDGSQAVTTYTIYDPAIYLTAGTYAIVLENTNPTETLSVGVYAGADRTMPAQILHAGDSAWQDLSNQKMSFVLEMGAACQ